MLKKGFTLQELLITMGIIGVISAIVLPAMMNAQPDKNKTLYMKAYNNLTSITVDALDNNELYWTSYDGSGANITKRFGLGNVEQPQIKPYSEVNSWEGSQKFARILHESLNSTSELSCDGNGANPSYQNCSFTTTDGIYWNVESASHGVPNPGADDSSVLTDVNVTINLKPSDSDNACLYSAECTKPNEFKFAISNEGDIQPADALGMAYLQSASNTTSKSDDRELASQIVSSAGSSTDVTKISSALSTIIKKNSKK